MLLDLHVHRCRAMNTEMETILLSQSEQMSRALEQIVNKWFYAVEHRFSRFLPESELSYLNSHSGRLTIVSGAMAEVLALAEAYRIQTQGIFTPFVYDALHAAGYDQSFEKLDREKATTADEFSFSPAAMTLHLAMKAVQLRTGSHLDLGGIAKGWSAEKLAGRLRRKHGVKRGLVNAGGDVQVWGGSSSDEPWYIGISSPWNRDEELAIATLREGSVATSSVWGRRWKNSQHKEQHHLIDPRTMKPGNSDVAQCSIVGDSVIACEIWAKVVCILGLKSGEAMLRKHCPRLEALIVSDMGDIHLFAHPHHGKERWEINRIDFFHDITM
ncbi:FAD:protein FMN transferase [Brevibacillus choshinensis]|uniref:FAD:protein FMN transferase n=1 Tax=Brevibacillus choshinensis TaxID=54911 RepID=UPI002E1BE0D4|nr:FAD:protein FMN transferase [Brevibacillus choshinensis]